MAEIDCRQAAKLLSISRERELSAIEGVALRFHLSLCEMCRNFDSQLDFLRKAAQRFRGDD